MKNENKIISLLSIVFLILICFSVAGGCGGGGDDNDADPDPPPANGDDGGGDDDDDDSTPETGTGEIRGTVSSSTGAALNGVHVRAVNIDNTEIQVSAFSGIGSDITFIDGAFSIQNVPPGSYRVLIEKMDSRSSVFSPSRYSLFVIVEATGLLFPDEYYNGPDESATDDTADFVVITVSSGSVATGIDFITND